MLIAAAGAAPLFAMGSASAAGLPQTAVSYQATPKDGAKCSACVNFVEPNACKIVDGKISPEGWCVAFAPKG